MIPDPALGIPAGFDANAFNKVIKFAMQMGAPNDPDRRAKFIIKSSGRQYFRGEDDVTSTVRLDRDGRPFDPEVRIVAAQDQAIEVDVAIEIMKADADEVPVGPFRPTKAICTLLDEDYAKVAGAQELLYNADRYKFGYEPEADGLFDAGIHTMVFYALDES